MRRLRDRNPSRPRVPSSAHWMSSMMRTTGPLRACRSMMERTASNSLVWPARSNSSRIGAASVRVPTSGSSRATSLRAEPRSAASRAGSTERVKPRSASTNGAYGMAPLPAGRHAPPRTVAPRSLAVSATSPTSRLLPIPASPPTMTVDAATGLGRVEGGDKARLFRATPDECCPLETIDHCAPIIATAVPRPVALPVPRWSVAASPPSPPPPLAVRRASRSRAGSPASERGPWPRARQSRVRVARSVRPIERAISAPR